MENIDSDFKKKFGDVEIILRPKNPSSIEWSFRKWDKVPIHKLTKEDIEIMLETCSAQFWRIGAGECADSWCNVLTTRYTELSNRKFLLIAYASLVVAVISVLISVFKC